MTWRAICRFISSSVRSQVGWTTITYDAHAMRTPLVALISLLIDLFKPVDLPFDDNNDLHMLGLETDDTIDPGLLFDPSQPADTLYFIGKGGVDIYAQPVRTGTMLPAV